MSNLDDKLRAIKLQRKEQFANGKVEFEYFLSSSEIEAIKQVYMEEHWTYIRPRDVATNTWMTGIEWYNRFVDEAGKINLKFNRLQSSVGISEAVSKEIEAAARRAAGITEPKA